MPTHHIWISLKYFKCLSCKLQKFSNHFFLFQSIIFLNIKNYLFNSICLNKDKSLSTFISLKHLDISCNMLSTTRSFCFFSLRSLTILYLQHNSISNIEDNSFYLLLNLHLLDLSSNDITKLKRTLFNGLTNIKTINLTSNFIMYIAADTFKELSANTIHSSNVKVCCMSGLS